MKKLILTLVLSGSGTIFAAPDDLVFDVCENEICTPFFDGKITEWIDPIVVPFAGFEYKKIPPVVKTPQMKAQEKSFVSFIAGATGHTFRYIREAFRGIKETVVSAGYEKFEGTLEGPAGKVKFKYNFKNDKWSVSGE